MLIDLPISIIAYALAWNHGAIATVWVVVFGNFMVVRCEPYSWNPDC